MKITDLKGNIKVIASPQAKNVEAEEKKGIFSKAIEAGGKFSEGFVKGELSTLKGMSDIGQGVARTLTKPFIGKAAEKTLPERLFETKAKEFLAPQGAAENVGFVAEKFAEFLIPATKAAKAETALNLLTQGIKSPLFAATARVVGKSAIQGVSAGGVSLLQTGGDVKEAGKVAATAGIARGALATIGEGARALKIPERLYSTIFKNSKNDMLSELKASGLASLQRKDPAKFEEFIKNGVIRLGVNGEPILNDTLAERALDKGLRGSIRNMSNEVIRGALQSEDDAQRIASTYQGRVALTEKQYQIVLKQIAEEYKDVGFGELSEEAASLATKLQTSGGNVSALDALTIRRFFDKMRLASSFDKPATKLSMTQANLKTLADSVRAKINSIPGMGKVMEDYSFYIEALEALAKEAARRGNNQVISLIDSIFLGGGLGSANPAPLLTIGVLRRMLLSGTGMTAIGQGLSRSALSPAASALLESGSSGAQSLLKDRQ